MLLYMKRNPIKYNAVCLHVYVWFNVLLWFFILLHTAAIIKRKKKMMLSLMSANQLTICRRDDFFFMANLFLFLFQFFFMFGEIFREHTHFFFVGVRKVHIYWAQGDIAKAAFRIITIKSSHFYGHKARARRRHKAYKLKPKQFLAVCIRKTCVRSKNTIYNCRWEILDQISNVVLLRNEMFSYIFAVKDLKWWQWKKSCKINRIFERVIRFS